MASQLEEAKRRLFDKDALDVSNIKLFPGTNRDTTAEQVADQIIRAIAQIEAGDFEMVEIED